MNHWFNMYHFYGIFDLGLILLYGEINYSVPYNITYSSILLLFSFVEWAHKVSSSISDDVMNHFQLLGAVEALAAIFKVCIVS